MALAAVVGLWFGRSEVVDPAAAPIPVRGERIMVEVFNGTTVDGLARATTRRLRADGLDVVFYGNDRVHDRDTTLVIARRGDTVAARRVRDALGVGSILNEPDRQLWLDVTVLLGRDAAPADVSASTSARN